MKIRDLSVLASLLMTCAIATPVLGGVDPYVRVDYGQNQLWNANIDIRAREAAFQASGYPATFETVGFGYGPGVSAGVWILPEVRVGITYSYLRAVRGNGLFEPGLIYPNEVDCRMNEVGAEAAARFKKLAGLTVGGNVALGWAELRERFPAENADRLGYVDLTAHRTRPTCGVFVGIDRTNPAGTNLAGIAGFVRVGFQYRDLGRMPGHLTWSDGTDWVKTTGETGWTDFSGLYAKVGFGYDLVR
jgi:hypothetical protein